jgi:hypothetical protein
MLAHIHGVTHPAAAGCLSALVLGSLITPGRLEAYARVLMRQK